MVIQKDIFNIENNNCMEENIHVHAYNDIYFSIIIITIHVCDIV